MSDKARLLKNLPKHC